jgi:hypothetical protein
MKEFAMPGIKQALLGSAAAAALACVPMAPAAAGVHGFGHVHPFGLGRGLFGAVLGLATLPIAIASAVLSAGADASSQAPAYGGAPPAYAPPAYAPQPAYAPRPAYYPAPQTYYAPPAAYAPRVPVYYPQPRAYYAAPPAYYAPRPNYAPRPAYYGGYGGRVSYRSGGYAYPHR